jgi:hypothetical protein
MENDNRKQLDIHGYVSSILQDDLTHCFLCGRCDRKLDRHEVIGGTYRNKSKADGLWVMLCHDDCHEGRHGVHGDAQKARELRQLAQREAMRVYVWTIDEFRMRYGKNYL